MYQNAPRQLAEARLAPPPHLPALKARRDHQELLARCHKQDCFVNLKALSPHPVRGGGGGGQTQIEDGVSTQITPSPPAFPAQERRRRERLSDGEHAGTTGVVVERSVEGRE